jgi:ABC-type nickel/cobalt efflux system permease component RcnA
MRKTLLALLAFAGLGVAAIDAHPMGNFSVNRYARLEPSGERLALTYIVDFAEIPTFQETSAFPAMAGLSDPSALEASPEASLLTRRLARSWSAGLTATEDGVRLRFRLVSSSLRFSPGAGGLPTMKLLLALDAPRRGFAASTVRYADGNDPDRIGWREVVLRPSRELRISDADVGAEDRSEALTSYPADPTADIPRTVSARFRILPAPGKARVPLPSLAPSAVRSVAPARTPAPPRTDRDAAPPAAAPSLRAPVLPRGDRFTDLVSAHRLTAGVVALSLLIAFALGGLHALSPGHGKTVVAAYLVGSRGTARHALLLGAVVTASHTIGVFLLGIVTLALSKAIVPEKLYPAIQLLSGLTIVAIGASLFVRRWRRRAPEEHGHSHAIEVPESAPTASALLALGVSGGILPCPSALVVLLSAIALHRVGFGLVLIVAFSAGLAAVLSGIGILVVRAGRFLSRFDAAGGWARRRLPAFSALLIGLLGAAIAVRALPDVQHAFFLR